MHTHKHSDISFPGLEGPSVKEQLDAGKQHGGRKKIHLENRKPGQHSHEWDCACWVGIPQVTGAEGPVEALGKHTWRQEKGTGQGWGLRLLGSVRQGCHQGGPLL